MKEHTFSRTAVLSMLLVGMLGGFIPLLQATLLPQLVKEGRITLAQIGQVATAEAFGTVIGISLANSLLKPRGLRYYVVAAALAGLVLDLVTARLSGNGILAVRFGHGLCAGVLMWMWVGFLARSDNPGRWAAIYVTVQVAISMFISAWFAGQLIPQGGAAAGFAVVAGAYAVIAIAGMMVPRQLAPIGDGHGVPLPDAKGALGLFASFTQVAAITAMWVYVKPFGAQIGLDEATTSLAVSVVFGVQLVGGLFATAIAGRVRAGLVMVIVAAGSVAALAALITAHDAAVFIAAAGVFAFLWILGPPFHMPYLIELDPSRRSALHMLTVQLVGTAAGPALASLTVSDDNATGAMIVSMVLYATGGLIVAATGLRRLPIAQPA